MGSYLKLIETASECPGRASGGVWKAPRTPPARVVVPGGVRGLSVPFIHIPETKGEVLKMFRREALEGLKALKRALGGRQEGP